MHANYLDTLDWGILIAYFLILIGIGIWASLKRKKGSSLFLAERSLKSGITSVSPCGEPMWALPC